MDYSTKYVKTLLYLLIISGVIVGNPSGHDNQDDSFSAGGQTIIDSPTSIINLSQQGACGISPVKQAKCIIFSHEMFRYKNLETRRCADAEASLVKETFKNLGFEVLIYKDYTYQQIMNVLTKLSNDDYKKDDCICFFVLTHGEAKGLIWAMDVCYPISIFEDTISSIQTLAEKPKMIFIQARRGMRIDDGTYLNQQKNECVDATDQK